MNRIVIAAVVLLMSVLSGSAWARTWTSSSGKYTLEAELVEVKQGKAYLKKDDGKIIAVEITKLSEQDQQFLKDQTADAPTDPQAEAEKEKTSASFVSADEALKTQVSYQFVETSLADVMAYFSKVAAVNFYISRRSLDELGIGADAPVSAKGDKVQLAEVLAEILKNNELTYVPFENVVIVTTKEHAERMQVTRAYQVTKPIDPDILINEITRLIAPNSWDEVGGPGSLQPLSFGVLVISQQDAIHRQIAAHYKDLFRPLPLAKKAAALNRVKPGAEGMLDRPIDVQFLETPLRDVRDYLSLEKKIPLNLDEKSLNEYGLDVNTPVNIHLKEVTLRTALDLMLEPLGLTWYEENRKIEITTPHTASRKLFPVSYPMRELAGPGGLEEWAELITSTIAPHTWDEVGGPGTVIPTQRGTLEISQSYRVHQQIAKLLADIATIK